MTMSKELFLALLSMDACNRGYLPGIAGPSDVQGTQNGKASIASTKGHAANQRTGLQRE